VPYFPDVNFSTGISNHQTDLLALTFAKWVEVLFSVSAEARLMAESASRFVI
jgi:hypothetical protein